MAALADGRLSGEALAAVAAHLDGCPACLALAQAATMDTDPLVAALCRPDPANPYAREAGCDRAEARLRAPAEFGAASELPTVMAAGPRPLPVPPAGPAAGVMRYRSLRLHARGGLGEVHVALDEELSRQVALKRIQRPRAADPESRRRFLQEAEITARLEHPGVVPVYGLVRDDSGQPCYAMRFIQGETLQEALDRFHAGDRAGRDPGGRRLAMRDLLGRFVAVCNTVAYAHSRGVLHRDLKPANIMLGAYGETLVVDWGLAKAVGGVAAGPAAAAEAVAEAGGDDHTRTGQALGTPAFMSPEQARGDLDALGPRSDVYSLGATLYCLLTGKPPFDREVADVLRQVRRGEFPAPRRLDPSIDAALEAVCLKAMATEPADRYDSARALAEDVERWLADEPISAYREPAPARLLRWGRRHRPLVVGLAATLLAAVVALAAGTVLIGRQRTEALHQRDRAEENLGLARQVVDEMYTQVAVRLRDRERMDADQRDLLLKAARFYERFALPQSADPSVRLEAGRAGLRAGEILTRLGETGPAEAAIGRAMRQLDAVAAADPDDAKARRALVDGHSLLAFLYSGLGKKAEAEASWRRAAELNERLAAVDPADPAPGRASRRPSPAWGTSRKSWAGPPTLRTPSGRPSRCSRTSRATTRGSPST